MEASSSCTPGCFLRWGGYSVCLSGFPDRFVCCVFDLRYPGVHQSGSWSGQHQGGGRWTLPRHEWERRALWVGESNPSFSFTTPPSQCSSGSHSQQVWHLIHLICFAEHIMFKPFSENITLFFFNCSVLSSQKKKKKVSGADRVVIWDTVCYQGSRTWQMGKPTARQNKYVSFAESHSLRLVSSLSCCFPSSMVTW